MSLPMFLGGVGQMMEIAANSAAPMISGIQTASPWAAYAGEGAASLLGTGSAGAGAGAGAGASAAAAGGAAAEVGAAAGAGSAAAGGGGGALAALGPAAAVVGAGLAGLGAGWGMSEGIDSQKSGFWGEDEWGNKMSMFDATAAIGRDTDKAVERGLGGGFIESMVGADAIDTIGDVAGGGMTAATSILAAPVGAAEAMYSWFAD